MASEDRKDVHPISRSRTVGWTIRVPAKLKAELRARVDTLNAAGGGRWSANLLLVNVLEAAVAAWKEEAGR